MNNLVNGLSKSAEGIAAVIAILAGLYGGYKVVRGRPFTKQLRNFSGANSTRDTLLKLRGRTVRFDTALDFSVWHEITHRIANDTEYREILDRPASELNNKRLPLYVAHNGERLDSFASLIVSVKDSQRLKFSHGGTGVIQLFLAGKFNVEVRAYSAPSVEITLREIP